LDIKYLLFIYEWKIFYFNTEFFLRPDLGDVMFLYPTKKFIAYIEAKYNIVRDIAIAHFPDGPTEGSNLNDLLLRRNRLLRGIAALYYREYKANYDDPAKVKAKVEKEVKESFGDNWQHASPSKWTDPSMTTL
jgi:hypothetical protein